MQYEFIREIAPKIFVFVGAIFGIVSFILPGVPKLLRIKIRRLSSMSSKCSCVRRIPVVIFLAFSAWMLFLFVSNEWEHFKKSQKQQTSSYRQIEAIASRWSGISNQLKNFAAKLENNPGQYQSRNNLITGLVRLMEDSELAGIDLTEFHAATKETRNNLDAKSCRKVAEECDKLVAELEKQL